MAALEPGDSREPNSNSRSEHCRRGFQEECAAGRQVSFIAEHSAHWCSEENAQSAAKLYSNGSSAVTGGCSHHTNKWEHFNLHRVWEIGNLRIWPQKYRETKTCTKCQFYPI